MISIYLAAPWICRQQAAEAMDMFEAAGINVTSRWVKDHPDITDESENRDYFLSKQAIEDLEDIVQANAFVILNLEKSEGKAFEFGFAYAMGIPCMLVGERERNIFYHLPGVYQVRSVEEAITNLLEVDQRMVVESGKAN